MNAFLWSPLPALAITVVALTAVALTHPRSAEDETGRLVTVDGLRGLLALFVFIHHGAVWYAYSRGSGWFVDSRFYQNMGFASVLLFFMITGFLFFDRMIKARHRPMDWLRFFVARFFRVAPLYFAAVFVLLLFVAIQSGFTLRVPLPQLGIEVGRWLTMDLVHGGDVNQVNLTRALIAGVVWTLRYEWLFYLSLPAIAVLAGVRAPMAVWIPSLAVIAAVVVVCVHDPQYIEAPLLLPFASGMLAALLSRLPLARLACAAPVTLVLVIPALGFAYFAFSDAYSPGCVLVLTLAFVPIALGNDLFGLLRWSSVTALGRISYSVYLLHGLLLYLFFSLLHLDGALAWLPLDPLAIHWIAVLAITFAVVSLAGLTYRLIEKPAIDASGSVSAAIRSLIESRRQAAQEDSL